MIVLLSCSINLSSKVIQPMIPFTGRLEQDSVTIAISDLRRANAKLIQLDYERNINKNLRQIVRNDSILAEQARQENLLLRRSCSKIKKQRNVAYCGVGATIVLLILSLIK